MKFTVNETTHGSIIRQIATVSGQRKFQYVRPTRIGKKEMARDTLLASVKDTFRDKAPRGTPEGVLYVLEGKSTIAVACLVGPLTAETDVVSEVKFTSPSGQSFNIIASYNDVLASVRSLQQSGAWPDLSADSTLTLDEEEFLLKDFLG